MIKVRNNIIPFSGFKAMTIWPFIFIRKECTFTEKDLNHEKIHGRQQLEMLVLPFFLWYLVEWCVRLCMRGNAYRNISFEREAYINEVNMGYLGSRKWYSWMKYLSLKNF